MTPIFCQPNSWTHRPTIGKAVAIWNWRPGRLEGMNRSLDTVGANREGQLEFARETSHGKSWGCIPAVLFTSGQLYRDEMEPKCRAGF